MRVSAFLTVVSMLLAGSAWADNVEIFITKPGNGSSVGQRPVVEGTVTDSNKAVWVVVHPLEVSTYWVQPRVSVNSDGNWKVKIHIGRAGAIDVGQEFEIRGFVNPNEALSEGFELEDWPKAEAATDLIVVVRE